MRILEPLKYLTGSIVIYYVMAACSLPVGSSVASGGSSSGGASNGASSGGASSNGASSSGASSGGSGGPSSSGAVGSSGGSGGSSGSPVPDANADETQSGSRLKANYYVGSDGSKQFAYFTDSARKNEVCSYAPADDGSIRCMPSGAYVVATEFADSACTVEVAESSACSAPPYAIQTTPGTGCGYVTRVFSVGSPVTSLYALSGTSCVSIGATSASLSYVTVGAEVTASNFQVATVQAE
jgi:hypothetical protein